MLLHFSTSKPRRPFPLPPLLPPPPAVLPPTNRKCTTHSCCEYQRPIHNTHRLKVFFTDRLPPSSRPPISTFGGALSFHATNIQTRTYTHTRKRKTFSVSGPSLANINSTVVPYNVIYITLTEYTIPLIHTVPMMISFGYFWHHASLD